MVIIKPATVTESGIQRKTCKRCEDTYTEEIPKLEEEHKHQYTETITKEPTCTEKGIKTYVCTCGEQVYVLIPVSVTVGSLVTLLS